MRPRRSLLSAILSFLCLLPFASALAAPPGPTRTVRVEALIDGRSELHLSQGTARWRHLDAAAPGRHEFRDEPTWIDGAAWFPSWPDLPDRENRDCGCWSSVYYDLSPPLPAVGGQVAVRALQARWPPHVVALPAPDNGFTIAVELDDRGFLGSAWYVIEIDFTPDACPFASFEALALEISLRGTPAGADSWRAAGQFELAAWNDGLDPGTEELSFEIGSQAFVIPSGSFVEQGEGWAWAGKIGDASVDAALHPLGPGAYGFTIAARDADLARVDDPERLRLEIGNDAGEVLVPLAGHLGRAGGVVVPPR